MSRRAVDTIRVVALIVAVGMPIAVVTAYVHARGRNVPFWDQWELSAEIAIRAADRTLTLRDVIRQHNEHRLLFSNLTTAVLARTTDWNLEAEMYVSVALAALTLGLLLFALRLDCRDAVAIAAVPLAALLFSLRQDINWVMSLQTNLHFLILFTLGAVVVLRRSAPGWTPLGCAAVLAAGATFSQGSGVLAWPIVLAALPLLGYRGFRPVLFWLAAAAVTMWRFLDGYYAPTPPGSAIRWIEYLLTFLGNPFLREVRGVGDEARLIGGGGIVLLACNVLALRSRGYPWRRLATWIALSAFALGIAAIASVHRSQFGIRQALTARYSTQASFFWLGVIALGSMVIAEARRSGAWTRWRRVLVACNVALVAAVVLTNVYAGLRSWRFAIVSDAQVACLLCYPTTHDHGCLRGLHPVFEPDGADLRQRALILRRIERLAERRLAAFGEPHDGRRACGAAIGGDEPL